MENKKLLPAIVALLITAMVTTSITTIITPSIVSASATLVSPTAPVGPNTSVLVSVQVTNSTSDNIDNVRIIAPTGSGFTRAIGGASAAENLKLAAENLENAQAPLARAGENLKLAGENKKDAGTAISSAASSLKDAGSEMTSIGWAPYGGKMRDAGTYLGQLGDNMASGTENALLENSLLYNAGSKLREASAGFPEGSGRENIDNAGAKLIAAGIALYNGSLRQAAENISAAGDNIYAAGVLQAENDSLSAALKAAGTSLKVAENCLKDAAQFENLAGINLNEAGDYIYSAGIFIEDADTTDLGTAGIDIQNAGQDLQNLGNGLIADNFLAGKWLKNTAGDLSDAASELGTALGGDELADAAEHDNAAGDNMAVGTLNLEVAGDELIASAADITAAAAKLLATANAIGPSTWDMTEGTADYVQFDAIGDNVIVPSGSQTFVFLWTTPNVSIENSYTMTIASNKEGGTAANWVQEGTLTLTVDGQVPTLVITVSQVGVVDKNGNPVKNLVGTKLDNAKATITITASETLKSLGEVTVENSGGTKENFVPPVTMTTSDNKTYTGTFTVGAWDDNVVVVRVRSAKDLAGNENTSGMENTITVDTRAPVFVDNGLAGLIAAMERTNVAQAGTTSVFAYVDNTASQKLTMTVEDNIASADNGNYVISVTVTYDTSSASASRSVVVNNLWTKDPLTLNAGLNSIVYITATDRTGNTVVSDNVENIFIDTQAPTIAFNTIAGKTWDENRELINDNKPTIKVTVTDPGYPTTGLGVARENLQVYLDNDNDIANGYMATLENKDNWNVTTGVFENVYDNGGSALVDGTYWVTVVASDNLSHAGSDNVVASRSFTIDTTKPAFSAIGNITGWTGIVTKTQNTNTITISGSGLGAEVGGTVNVWKKGSWTSKGSGVVEVGGYYSVTATLDEGANELWVSLTDLAGNESDKVLYGTVTVDTIAPKITITSTVPETTDKTTLLVTGTCDDLTATVTISATALTKQTLSLGTDGSFSYAVPLSEGTNTITIEAIDPATNSSTTTLTTERTVTSWGTYAIILVIVALILAAIAIFRKR